MTCDLEDADADVVSRSIQNSQEVALDLLMVYELAAPLSFRNHICMGGILNTRRPTLVLKA